MSAKALFPSLSSFPYTRAVCELSLIVVLCCLSTLAQIDRAVLEGAVTDQTGAVIVGADVKVVATATGISQERSTNTNGYYRFPGLPVGRYSVSVSTNKFKTQVIDDVLLRIDQTRILNITLQVGAAQEEVTVNAAVTPAEKTSPEASMVIDTTEIASLPNNGRDWA